MRNLNLGILAHVDAGKTSLTERLLHSAGVIDTIGKVDDGSTQTDTLALERQRGITIKSAVASFVVDDITVNLIDTPGHPDFIAEVERALNVLDGAVLVISAVEAVEAQTRVLMRALQRLSVPTLIFVNKIDRHGADIDRALDDVAAKLTSATIPMGDVVGPGVAGASFVPHDIGAGCFDQKLIEMLAEYDDAVLSDYVDGNVDMTPRHLRALLAEQVASGHLHPVFFGSAITGAGVDALLAGITMFLPPAKDGAEAPLSGLVFKVDREVSGAKVAYVRMFEGVLRAREQVMFGQGGFQKVTALSVFAGGSARKCKTIVAGQIGKVWGLVDVCVGDVIGATSGQRLEQHFAPPTLETAIFVSRETDRPALYAALSQLSEQDPLINLRQDDVRQELFVSLYGEVQKEVIAQTLLDEFGISVGFRETTMICVERVIGRGAAMESLKDADNPFYATVGLRVDPGPLNSGVQFGLEVELGSIPLSFHVAVEETVHKVLREGLYGWQVTDCIVTMTHSGFLDAVSTAGHFRNITPLVLMAALKEAGTAVCAPVHEFRLEVPQDVLGIVSAELSRLGAVPGPPVLEGLSFVLEGEMPAMQVHALQRRLPALSRGGGVLETRFGHYEPVRGATPSRDRTDNNPLNRKAYLMRLASRA